MATQSLPVMGHLVLGYPTLAASIATAETYVRAGVGILELQIPFSHPTADGPVITAACRVAVEEQQVSVDDALSAIRTLRERYPEQEIIVMSYLNRVFAYGMARFVAALEALKIKHLIVPDLPVDSAVAAPLNSGSVRLVPVLAANVTDERLQKLLTQDFDFFYLMSDFKITGSAFSLHPRLQQVIATIRAARPAARIGIGFGISSAAHAQVVVAEADYAIIGSALIQAESAGNLWEYLTDLSTAFSSTVA